MKWPLLVFAFATPALVAADEPGIAGSRDWLVGAWVPEGESCESDAGVVYERDGSWIAYGESGKWTLRDGAIISEVMERPDDSGELRKLRFPEVHVQKLTAIGADKYTSRWPDGTVEHFSRCPASSE